jgi:hypothetical protein
MRYIGDIKGEVNLIGKDLMVFRSIIVEEVQYVITEDMDLLLVGRFKDVKIVDPRTF